MSYSVHQSNLDADRDQILALWRRNLPNASPGRYAWLYESGTAASWLVTPPSGEVVGAVGLMNRRLCAFGNPLRVGQAIDLNVDAEHRIIGPALKLQRAIVERVKQDGFDFVYTVAPTGSEPIARRAGFHDLGSLQRWIRPLRLSKNLSARLGKPRLGRIAAPIVNPLLAVETLARGWRRRSDGRAEPVEQFDAPFDALWDKAARRFAVIGERTADYLGWRFGQSPSFCHKIFGLRNDRNDLAAYLVYHHRDRLVYIGDFFFDDFSNLKRLLCAFACQMRHAKAEALVAAFFGADSVSRALRRSGFWQIPTDRRVLLYTKEKDATFDFNALLDPQNWFLTQADIDTDY